MSFIFVPLPQLNLWPLRLVASDFHVMLAFAVHLHFIPAWTYGLRLALQKLGTLNISQTLWFIYHNGVVGEVYWFHSVRPSVRLLRHHWVTICYKFSCRHPCHNWLFNSLTFCVGSCYQTETANQWVCGTGSWWVTLAPWYSQLVHSTLLNDSE